MQVILWKQLTKQTKRFVRESGGFVTLNLATMLFLPTCLLFCLVSTTALCSPAPETDHEKERVRKEDDVSLDGLQRVVQQQASTINRLEAKLTATENQLNSVQAELTATKNQMTAQGNQLQMMQHKMNVLSKSVAFTARISAQHDNHGKGMSLGDHQTVVFDNVLTNVGNAYDPSTGIFTAPVNGVYVFNLCEMGPIRSHSLYLDIVKNGVVLDRVFAAGSQSDFDQGCSQVSTLLVGGDHVWVRQLSGTLVRADWYTIFTGFLLHAE